VNEYSTRYSEAIDSMATTDVWRSQSKTNKQGSGTDPIHWPEDPARERVSDDPNMHLSIKELEFHDHARCIYKERLAMGVAREQARKDLPLSTYTEAYWKIDLHNLFHFLDKRLRSDAQQEIREFAEAIAQLISSRVPMAWAAFKCYKMNAVTFSDHEMLALHNMLVDTELTPLTAISKFTTNDRERKEFVAKVMPC
jgi:thymidylate synthase (FAD)